MNSLSKEYVCETGSVIHLPFFLMVDEDLIVEDPDEEGGGGGYT